MGVFIKQVDDSEVDVCNIMSLHSLTNNPDIKIIQVFILNSNYFLVEYTRVH